MTKFGRQFRCISTQTSRPNWRHSSRPKKKLKHPTAQKNGICQPHILHIFARHTSQPFAKPKEQNFPTAPRKISFIILYLSFVGQDQNRYIMLGEKLKELREAKGLVQRQVAADLQVDTAYISKMEHNEKPVSRTHLKKLAKLYSVTENDLLPIWLADKILQLVENEKYSVQALEMALNKVKDK